MPKLTVLTMTQKILSSMDSDDVNSISDTEEALQVVDIIEDTYNHLIIELDPPSIRTTCQLTNLGDVTQPTTLTIPDTVTDIDKIKYEVTNTGDLNRSFRDLEYCTPQDFIDKLLFRSSGNVEVEELTSPSGTPLLVFNDRFPRFWTSFDDENIVADSYDKTESTTLLGSKTTVLCTTLPTFTKSDTFIPDFPEKAFPLLLAESKRACHIYLKQQDSAVDAKRSLQGNSTYKSNKGRAHDTKRKVNFGRQRNHQTSRIKD